MTLAPTLPTSEYSCIIQQAIIEISSTIDRHNRAANAWNLAHPEIKKPDQRKVINREGIETLIVKTSNKYLVSVDYIRKLGQFYR